MEEIYKNLSIENLENEIWLPVVGFEGLYEVSSYGRVKSLNYRRTKQEKIIKQEKDRYGYLIINICKNGKRKIIRVHRLVAKAFIDNPNNLETVNHKNEDKTDNRIDNLEWLSRADNIRYGTAQERRILNINYQSRTKNTNWKAISEKKSKVVYQYSIDGKLIKIWASTQECGINGYHRGAVAACCRGERKLHKGYIWSYTEL